MSTASIGKSAIAVALVLSAVAGCDSSVRSEGIGATHASPARPYALREKHDMARARTWVLHADGLDLYDAGTNARLQSFALPEWIWAGQFHACPPDLAIGPKGDVFVSSNVIPVIWRVDAASFQVSRHELALDRDDGREVGFSRLTYSAPRGVILALNGLDGSLWRIDASLAKAQQVTHAASMPVECEAQQHTLNTNFQRRS